MENKELNNDVQAEVTVEETEVSTVSATDVLKDSAFVAGAGFALYGIYTAGKKVYTKVLAPKVESFKQKRAEKKAAKEAMDAAGGADELHGKKIYRRKGESRLVAERRSERQDDGIKRTGRVIHVTSKRSTAAQPPADEY